MATITQAKAAHPLAPAVLRQLGGGRDAVAAALDAAKHGADGGVPGFTRHVDTIAFARRYRAKILAALREDAESMGESSVFALVRSFRCLEDAEEQAIARALYAPIPRTPGFDVVMVLNALSWYALEAVGRAIQDAAA